MSAVFLLLLAAVAIWLQWLSKRHCLDGLDVEAGIDRRTAECTESFTLTTVVTNARILPVFFLHLSECIPCEMDVELDGTGVVRQENILSSAPRSTLEQATFVMPRQRLTRVLTASISKRGRYVLRDIMLQAGDFLGLEEQSAQFRTYREIVILPPRADMAKFEPAFGHYLGDISAQRFIFPDPILTAGFREYTGREPQRDISWPRSLRDGRLMVKQYDHTSELTATVILNISGGSHEEMEDCFSTARCVCERLEKKHISYSFLTNASIVSGDGGWSYISDGLGARHLATILTGLGSASYAYISPLDRLLERAGSKREQGRGFILITPALGSREMSHVRKLERQTGQRVLILAVREKEAVV